MIDDSAAGETATGRTAGDPGPGDRLGTDPVTARLGWVNRRRERIVAEIERNRRGEYKVPTWVLVAVLLAIVAAWAALIVFS